jgi:putative ABC transport system permease protein
MAWDNPIGKKFIIEGEENAVERKVVGVIKDYHQNSLYDPIEPLMILWGNNLGFIYVKIKPGNIQQSLASIEKSWKSINPNNPFEYDFLDQDFNSQYKADEKRSFIFTVFSGLTIIIACLGLLGLAAFTTEQRTKEIGIRKVLGASSLQIIVLLARNILLLVLAGAVVASIGAYFAIDEWLAGFAYRAGVNPLVFILSTLVAAVVAFVTIALQSFRTASADPAESLRYE